MKYQISKLLFICFLISGTICFLPGFSVLAFVMESSNYKIESDSINVGGLDLSSSTNYNLKDTIGELGTGGSSSDNFNLYAGYRQMDESYISLTISGDVTLTPVLGGISGGTANGYGTWTVKTDSASGYSLSLRSENDPALQSGANSFFDYSPLSVGIPDLTWDIDTASSEFGFSPYNPTNQASRFMSNGADCSQGGNIVDEDCWLGLSQSNIVIANSAERTAETGDDTKVNFRAEINSVGGNQAPGLYTASLIITAASN